MLGQPCNKFDIPAKLIATCQQIVSNFFTALRQAVQKQFIDGLSKDLLHLVRYLHRLVYFQSSSDCTNYVPYVPFQYILYYQ